MTPEQKIIKARSNLILDQPFWGTIGLSLDIQADPDCQGANGWTDGETLGYHPGLVDAMSIAHCKSFQAHEYFHIANLHHLRGIGKDWETWNRAADLVTNRYLEDAGFDIPDNWPKAQPGDDRTPEQHYDEMMKRKREDEDQPQPDGDDDNGQPQDGDGDGDSQNETPGPGDIREPTNPDGSQLSEAQQTTAENEVKAQLAQAKTVAEAAGNMPADLDRIVQDIIEPDLSAEDLLKEFVSSVAKNDYRLFPPNRRFIYLDVYYPSLRSDELGEIVLAVDTSISVSEDELNLCAGFMTDILEAYPTATLKVVYCDTECHNPQTFTQEDLPVQLDAKGGGGTDFRPPFKWVEDEDLDPVCFIYLTDMRCSSYPEEPDYPVLWLATQEHYNPAPFGETITL